MRRQRRAGSGTGRVASLLARGKAPGKRTLTEQVQRRSSPRSSEGAAGAAGAAGLGSSGEPLPSQLRQGLEARAGADLSGVRVHAGEAAAEEAAAAGARAFTRGRDIFFGAGAYQPGSAEGDRLIAHEVAHTVQQSRGGAGSSARAGVSAPGDAHEQEAEMFSAEPLGGSRGAPVKLSGGASAGVMRAPGPLSDREEAAAVAFNRERFDVRSARAIQIAAGTRVDGDFGPITAQAVATWEASQGLTETGRVEGATLSAFVVYFAANGDHELAIQVVVDSFNLDVTSDTLTVSYDSSLAAAHHTEFESGNLRVITIGPVAFIGAEALRDAILAALGEDAPEAGPVADAPDELNRAQQRSALGYLSRYGDVRSIRAVQGLVGDEITGTADEDLVQRIAGYQSRTGLEVDGKIGDNTLEQMVYDLAAADDFNAALRLIIDFHDLRDHFALLDIRYDPDEDSRGLTSGYIPGPSEVTIGPAGFTAGYEVLVHTIAHELEHVRQRRVGMENRHEREFLAEELEMLSRGTREEEIGEFMADAKRALRHWNELPEENQRRLWSRFTRLRRKVSERLSAASAADQANHQDTLIAYNAVTEP